MRSDIVSRLLSGTLFTGIGNAVDKAANLISFVLIVRFMTKEEVGAVVIAILAVNVYKIINNLLLDELWVAKTISSSEDSREYLSCLSFTYSVFTSLLFVPVVFFSFPVLIEKLNVFPYSGLSIYVSLIFLLNCVSGMLLRILQGWHEYKKIGLIQSTLGGGRLVLIFILVVIFNSGIDGVLISYFISYLLTTVLVLKILPFRIVVTFNNNEYKKLLVKGIPLSLNSLLTFLYNKIDRVIVTSIVGVVGLAIYESATKIPQNIRFAYKSYMYVLFPNLSELYSQGDYSEIKNILNNSIRVITFFTCFFCIFIFVFQEDITVLFFSIEYSEGAPVLAILSLALCIAIPSNLMGTSLVAFGQPDKPVKINIVETITNIIANLVLIPVYGLIGAAFATLLSRCITNPVNLYFIKRTEVSVDVSQYIKPLVVCVSVIIVNIYLSPKLLLYKILLVFMYPATCYLLSICNKSDFVFIYKKISSYRRSGNI